MRVTVKRDSGLVATASKFQLIVDGEKIDKIKNNETIELDLPKESATIKVSQYDAKTNEEIVTDGDQVMITATSFGTNSRLLMTIALMVVIIGQNIILQGVALLIGIGLFLMIFLGKKPNFRLEKINTIE